MGMNEQDHARQAALRLVMTGADISASRLGMGLRDVVGPAPRLVKAARELLGWTVSDVAMATGFEPQEVRGCERAGGAPDRVLCVLQLWLEGKGARFYEADFHGEYGVRLALGWTDDRRVIRAACALLGKPLKALAEVSGLSLGRFEKVMRQPHGIVPPISARAMIARLGNEGAKFVPAAPCGWSGVRLGHGERLSL